MGEPFAAKTIGETSNGGKARRGKRDVRLNAFLHISSSMTTNGKLIDASCNCVFYCVFVNVAM